MKSYFKKDFSQKGREINEGKIVVRCLKEIDGYRGFFCQIRENMSTRNVTIDLPIDLNSP